MIRILSHFPLAALVCELNVLAFAGTAEILAV
jgi:hypothetical protein